MKKVSVIVPVYNMEKYLKECMDSLVNQTLDDIEIIVINDGSKDNSLKILKEYEEKYSDKVKIIDQENGGISVARNNGLKIATGKYIGFVDSDDYVEKNMFEVLFNKIEETNSDIVVCNYKKYNMGSSTFDYIDMVKNINKETIFDDPTIINSIYYAPWNKLYKRDLFNNITFPINKKYEDINAILKVFFKAKKISKVDDALYIYRINESGETFTINKKINDIVFIMEDLVKHIKNNKNYNLIENELKKLCVDQLFYYLVLSYELKDKEYIFEFRNDIIRFLDENFSDWKKSFLCNSKLKIRFVSKIILINNFIFNRYINRKFK